MKQLISGYFVKSSTIV